MASIFLEAERQIEISMPENTNDAPALPGLSEDAARQPAEINI